MERTVMEVMAEAAKKFAGRPALKSPKGGGQWETITWEEYHAQVRLVARAFIHLGMQPGDAVAIIGYNCPQWLISDLGAIFAGGFPAGIYTTNSPEQCRYIADHSGASIAVVENAQQLAKFKEIRDRLPRLKAIVMMYGSDDDEGIYSWSDLPALAEKAPESELDARIAAQKPKDLCTLIYTSGTTGDPKAVMITHDNLTWTAKAVVEAVESNENDHIISYLPLSHIAEQVVSVHTPQVSGACVWFAESLDKLGDNLRQVRPTIFVAVPRVWEKIQAKMVAAGAQNPPLKKKIAAWARKVGLAAGYAEQQGKPRPLLYPLADALVFSKVRQRLGLDRCRLCITTAAPISLDTLEFFLSLGIRICEVYGMSECTGPATLSLWHRYRTGMAGPALPGAEIKIADDGEVLIRGRHVFAGYYKNEEATRATLDEDGWLHSGDIGTIDKEGFLKITDRKKDLIITAGGENIAPQVLEGKLKAIPAIAQAVVIGDKRKYVSALFTLDPEKLQSELAAAGSPAKTMEETANCPKFREYLQKQIDQVNSTLARVQTIKRWIIIPNEFTIDGGELTPTMKIKRRVINEKYARQIEELYPSS
jgi:long-subunit acyl-CoA synthetase (AMP-forming)